MKVNQQLHRQIEQHPYPLLFATISGAHLYGFPSHDSDYDLRGVHLLPLEEVVGLNTGPETVEKSGIHNVYRVLLTGIHLMRTGEIEANLVRLNEMFGLSYIPELIDQKTHGREKEPLEQADLEFHEREYRRLRAELEQAFSESELPEAPTAAKTLNHLLIKIRLQPSASQPA